jgi:light-regulated signal transduction histidine kinase (bacteriophytochrome)
LDEKGRRYLGTIRGAVARMGMLIDDLLTFSRIGRAELRAGPVRLDAVVQAVLPELEQEIARRAARLELRPLPVVRGDAALLQVVFANLLSNALKYTRPRAEPRIEIGSEAPRDGQVVVFVRDNGVGFDMQYAGKLFGVFQRLHSSDQFEGTGIGLATVQRVVHKHGGQAWAEGAVDRGATIYLALPPADPAAPLEGD